MYIDVNIDYIYNSLSSRDKKELIEWLDEDGDLEEHGYVKQTKQSIPYYSDDEWNAILQKLYQSHLRLTSEEEKIIRAIADRF